jgi:glycosyltransferase involved in cell wall biosynthesis
MKVIRVTTELNYGGIEKVFELHARYHTKGYELIFIALGKGGSTEKILQELGFKVIVLNKQVRIPSFHLLKKLRKIFEIEKPDIIHAAGAEANFHATIAAKLAGVEKVICEEIGIPEHNIKAKLLFRFIYLNANKVIAISKAVENFLISSKEVSADKLQLLYNPVNEAVDVKHLVKDEFLFSIVARLEPVKNIPLLIDAFYEFQKERPKAKLNIIGEGSQKKALQDQVKKLGIEGKVFFKGFIPNPNSLLLESSYFVLPSLFEGFGLACIEAIQAENIVICTNSGGIPEFIENGEHGFLINPKSKKALLEAMNRAVALSDNDKKQMIGAAKRRVLQLFSPHKYADQLQSLYCSV